MGLQNEIVNTFSKRAESYDSKMEWVFSTECLNPMILEPLGNKRALDACAGTGAISHALIDKGWSVFSLDMSREMLEKSNLPAPIVGDVQCLPFLDGFFDLVVCRQGLQYTDLEIAISELIRVSSNTIIIGHITKAIGDSFPFWDEYFSIASPGRKHIFKPGQLQEVIHSLGFSCNTTSVVIQKDNYIGPIMYLDKEKREFLINMLLNTPYEFKKLYNVHVNKDGRIQYENRWEFVNITKLVS